MDNKSYSLRPKPVIKMDKIDIPKPTLVSIPEAPEMSILLPSNKLSAQDLARSALLKFKNALSAQRNNTPAYVNIDHPVIQPSPQLPIVRPTPRPVFSSHPLIQPKNQTNSFSSPPIPPNPFQSAPRIKPTVSVKQYQDDNKLVTETSFRQ